MGGKITKPLRGEIPKGAADKAILEIERLQKRMNKVKLQLEKKGSLNIDQFQKANKALFTASNFIGEASWD